MVYDMLNGVVEEFAYLEIPKPCIFLNSTGSCNGLLCTTLKHNVFILWNPFTRDLVELPSSSIEFPTRSRKCLSIVYGFGYDSFSDDYKLLRVFIFAAESFKTEVKLYSLRTNSWRRIDYQSDQYNIVRLGYWEDAFVDRKKLAMYNPKEELFRPTTRGLGDFLEKDSSMFPSRVGKIRLLDPYYYNVYVIIDQHMDFERGVVD
ncbi:hypothetical protein SO802_027168 [Lithocarpus litseifolius]|uniref:F-box associated beta-propeller type 1 domain-containing protein n=1 Tax=Lithocarpus litseifolius TaxID=425828 RepID=A0AAW2C2M5_9ROSI